MHIGWLLAVVPALALPPAAGAIAAADEPALRRSDQIDNRRLGSVSETERSVLRVEWRAKASAADEARTVQEMLDSLRRMDATVDEIRRLIGGIPPPAARVAAPVAAAPAADEHASRLALASLVAAGLVALWWFRRRHAAQAIQPKSDAGAAPQSNPDAAPEASPAVAVSPVAMPPATPLVQVAAADAASAAPEQSATPPTPPMAEIPPIEFSLDAADPEAIRRANAKAPPPAASVPRAPRKPRDSNVEPTLELAEIMLSMGLAQGAAQALVEYSEANPRQALYHWLKLLDIYRNGGHREDFKETAEKLRQHFNIQAEDWTRASAGEQPTLENFSRVSQQVQQIWSRPEECTAYLRHLLEDNREGSRAGFPRPVAEEILLLIEILKPADAAQAAGT